MYKKNDELEEWLFEDLFNPKRLEIVTSRNYGIEIKVYIQKKLILATRFNYDEIIIGRKSSVENVDLDLSPYDNGKTISRKTILITRTNDEYQITRVGRVKVKLNDQDMEPQKPYNLKNDAENLVIICSNPPIGLKITVVS